MRRFDVSGAWRAASPRHRTVNVRSDWVKVPLVFLRLVAVGLLSAVGWVHLHLWQAGYRHIPTIGTLFLVAAVSALAVAAGMLVRPTRLIGLSGIALVMSILAGLIVSINIGLFGFTESLSAPFAVESIVLELAAAVTLASWVAIDIVEESRQATWAVQAASGSHRRAQGHPHPSTCSTRLQQPTSDRW
jgi:hypothetical protein